MHTHNKYDFKYFSESGVCGTYDFLAIIFVKEMYCVKIFVIVLGLVTDIWYLAKEGGLVFFPDVLIKTMAKGSLQGRDGVNNFTSQLTTHQQGKPRWKLKAGAWRGNYGGILLTGFLSQAHALAFLTSPGLPV